MNNSINAPRLTSALQLIEQAAAVLVAVSLSAEEMDAAAMSWMRLKRAHLWLTMLGAELVISWGVKNEYQLNLSSSV